MEEVLEAEAIEEDAADAGDPEALPAVPAKGEVSPFKGDARTVAIAAAGGVVAGAATVAVVKAATRAATPKRKRGLLRKRKDDREIVASRSFMVDVHLLGR